jgi:hypothetical protein
MVETDSTERRRAYNSPVRDRVVLLLALAALPALAGCGSGSAQPVSLPGATQQLLSQTDVNAQPPGSPERAFLAWWRDVQYANLAQFKLELVPALRDSFAPRGKMPDAINYFSGALRSARPKIRDVSRTGTTAVVYAIISYRQPVGTSRYVTTTVPRAFTFTKIGGRWLLADDSFAQATLPPSLKRTS